MAEQTGTARSEPVLFTLANGLTVVVIEDHRAPAVTHMVWYRVGSADEPSGQSGLAHFLEHLMFKSTETRPQGAFSRAVEAEGGQDNAFTSWDFTAYFQRIAADRLELVMALEADRMRHLTFRQEEWLPERDVILEERGQTVESRPERLLQEEMQASLFRNHPYGRPIIGWREEIATLDGEAAERFYRAHYGPDNAIVVVAGAVSVEAVRALAERHYGAIPPRAEAPPRLRPVEPLQRAERRVILTDPRVSRPSVVRMYRVPPRRAGDQTTAAALQLLAAVLGGSEQTSVLERRLTFEEKLTLSAWASYSGTARDHGIFMLGVVPAQGVSAEEAEKALDRVLAAFLAEGVDPDQFARIKQQVRAQEVFELDSSAARARAIGSALAVGLSLADATGWLAALQAVQPEDVLAALRLLDRRASVTGWLLPEEAK